MYVLTYFENYILKYIAARESKQTNKILLNENLDM